MSATKLDKVFHLHWRRPMTRCPAGRPGYKERNFFEMSGVEPRWWRRTVWGPRAPGDDAADAQPAPVEERAERVGGQPDGGHAQREHQVEDGVLCRAVPYRRCRRLVTLTTGVEPQIPFATSNKLILSVCQEMMCCDVTNLIYLELGPTKYHTGRCVWSKSALAIILFSFRIIFLASIFYGFNYYCISVPLWRWWWCICPRRSRRRWMCTGWRSRRRGRRPKTWSRGRR